MKTYIFVIVFFASLDDFYSIKLFHRSPKGERGLILTSEDKSSRLLPEEYFSTSNSGNTIFCPAETDEFRSFDERCLVPKKDNKNPFCTTPPEPTLIKSEFDVPCGEDGKSVYYDFLYRICFKKEKDAEDELDNKKKSNIHTYDKIVYRLCFNPEKEETVFTYYKVTPALLTVNQLEEERKKKYELRTNSYQFSENIFKDHKQSYAWYKNHYHTKWKRYKLKPLFLLSPEDIPYALLKKPVYHFINIKPAWSNILELWEVLNDKFQKQLITEQYEIFEMSGTYEELELKGEKIYLDSSKHKTVPKYFWKLIHIPRDDELLALVVHNVPSEEFSLPKLCYGDHSYAIDGLRPKFAKLAYLCRPDAIAAKLRLPESISLLRKKVMAFDKGQYHFPKSYDGLHTAGITHFCYDEAIEPNTDRIFEKDKCLVPSTNTYCRIPIQSYYKDSTENVPYCNSNTESYINELYQICKKEGRKNVKNDYLVVFSFCFDTNYQKTVFTSHQIKSPSLLRNQFLKQERQTNISMEQHKPKKSYRNGFHLVTDIATYEWDEFYSYRFHYIQVILLVSPNDMPFFVLKKATYSSSNRQLAFEKVIAMWDLINERIRTKAINEDKELIQINGWDGILKLNGEVVQVETGAKLPKYFWKVVYSPDKKQGIAIILHNVTASAEIEEKLCSTSICNIKNWDFKSHSELDKFAYCCEANVITQKRKLPEAKELMRIPDYFLPVVMTLQNGRYHFPKTFNGLEHSESDSKMANVFLCPDENIKNEYLVPNKNLVPYCTKPVKPIITSSEKACGGQKSNTHYYVMFWTHNDNGKKVDELTNDQIVYEFCYDSHYKKLIYIQHQIKSPTLLKNDNLKTEREFIYSIEKNGLDTLDENFEALNKALKQRRNYQFKDNPNQNYQFSALFLISSNDMPFTLWRKQAYNFIKVQPAWDEVVKIWEGVNKHFQDLVIDQKKEFIQIDGVSKKKLNVEGDTIYWDESKKNAMSAYFWKIVYNSDITESLLFVLHNVPSHVSSVETICEPLQNKINEHFMRIKIKVQYAYFCDPKTITESLQLPVTQNLMKVGDIEVDIKS